MGKFDGILICTDFDSSVAWRTVIPEENVKAIKYFKDNGGLFSLITGRNYSALSMFCEDAMPNTYIGAVNGTMIYDHINKAIISESFLCDPAKEQVMLIKEKYSPFTLSISTKSSHLNLNSEQADFEERFAEATSKDPVRKYYFWRKSTFSEEEYAEICAMFPPEYEISRSSLMGIEIQRAGSNKGSAAKRIKELTGSKLLVCLGDFENDASMIEAADIGYAVENSTPSLIEIADRVTVHCQNGAIAAIVKDLERDIAEGKI